MIETTVLVLYLDNDRDKADALQRIRALRERPMQRSKNWRIEDGDGRVLAEQYGGGVRIYPDACLEALGEVP